MHPARPASPSAVTRLESQQSGIGGNRLLEVIPHDGTSDDTVATSLLAAKLHGKTAILVKDAPGFAVNRFFVPFLNEAVRLLLLMLALNLF